MAETVAEIADLPNLDGKRFFDETHVTEGMATLLRQVFQRLTGQSDQGVYRLKQAMGGGKTHNLLAAALLARDPGLRTSVFPRLGVAPDARTIRVCAFSGRETDMQDYLWVRIFRDLGREAQWTRTTEVPGPSTWAKVIGEEPALILLDELPPYFVSLVGQQAGAQTSEADRLAIALANLMNAILSNKLPNCCLVISDLVGSWAQGAALVQQAISNASNEVTRAAMDLVPVRLDSGELYGILQRKLFEKLPGKAERRKVGQQYATALRTAVQQGIVPESYERWAQEVVDAYPFHPGLRELFARFRENEDFQQTRGTLRLAQRMVAGAWAERPGKPAPAETALLLHPHMVDLTDHDTASTFERVNPALNNARARDIATVDGTGIAQKVSADIGDPTGFDAAKLLFVSSLPVGPNALQGLNAEEVAAYLAAPGRDVSSANAALMIRLEEDSWYLHRRTDGRWHYRNVKNVTSAIRERVETLHQNERIKEVANYLRASFDPTRTSPLRPTEAKHAYQRLLVFPTPAEISATISWNETLLVILTPSAGGFPPEITKVWDNAVYPNRLLFLFGRDTFTKVTLAAAYKKAAEDQVDAFIADGINDVSPEMKQAKDARERNAAGFLSALRETFTQLYFPDLQGRLRAVPLRLQLDGNQFVGQLAILDTLKDEQKFRTDVDTDRFRNEFETHVFPTQEATWRQLMETTAQQADWYLVPPGGHETMKTRAFTQDVWRDDGGDYIKKGPFPQDPTSVQPQLDFRDASTGRCSLRIVARHADRVHYEEGGSPATVNSPVVQNGRLETSALKVSFLAIDTSGRHQPGPVVEWQNTIQVKYDLRYQNGAHTITLKAVPQGTIRFSLDGSDPRNGAIYDGAFQAPASTKLVQAVAEQSGITSSVTQVPIPTIGGGPGSPKFRPNPTLRAEWTRRLSRSDRAGSYRLLQVLKRHAAKLSGAQVNVSVAGSEHWIDVSFGRSIVRTAEEIEKIADTHVEELRQSGPTVAVALSVLHIFFDSGSALEEAARELEEPLNADEVKQ
jgi:hypothetical protein